MEKRRERKEEKSNDFALTSCRIDNLTFHFKIFMLIENDCLMS